MENSGVGMPSVLSRIRVYILFLKSLICTMCLVFQVDKINLVPSETT